MAPFTEREGGGKEGDNGREGEVGGEKKWRRDYWKDEMRMRGWSDVGKVIVGGDEWKKDNVGG